MKSYKAEFLKNATSRGYDLEIYEFQAESDEKAIEFAKKARVLRNSFAVFLRKRKLWVFWSTIYRG